MIATSALITGGGDLPAIIQQAMAVGATAPAAAPVLSIVLPGGDSLTIQQGGDLAIYRAIGPDYFLFACGCQGEIVNEIPRAADCVLLFNLLGDVHRIYRYGDTYYDFPGKGDYFIEFKAYLMPPINEKSRPTEAPPGSDHPCSNHDSPQMIPEEYKEVVRKETPAPFRKPENKADRGPGAGAGAGGPGPGGIVAEKDTDKLCSQSHNAPVFIPKEYRDITEKDDLVKDQRKPRDRDRC